MSKRRTFTPEFKAQVVLEELTGVKDVDFAQHQTCAEPVEASSSEMARGCLYRNSAERPGDDAP